MAGKQRDTLRPHNVMTVIARAHCACLGPVMGRHSIPDCSNELGKHSFQNEFLNQREEREETRGKREQGLGAFGARRPGFNQPLGEGSEDVMKMRRWPLFAVCHGIDFPDTMLQCMTDQSN